MLGCVDGMCVIYEQWRGDSELVTQKCG